MNPLRHATLSALAVLALATPGALHADDPEAVRRLDALTRDIDGQLAALDGKQMYLFLDKPLYHPGEAVWFRAFELKKKTLTGVPGEHGVTFELVDPRGAKILEKKVLARGGMATNDFTLSPDLAGGTYTLRATSTTGVKEERTFTVSTYEAPRIKKTIDFGRTSYAPGDRVTANITLERATGEAMVSAKVSATISVDGAELARYQPMVDAKGRAFLVFDLPRRMIRGEVFVTLAVDAGGVTESMQRRVPVTLDEVEVSSFPEGGDLVVGLPSRVYLMGRDPQGKPAEMEGRIVDDTGRVITTFKSLHAGMARVALTPAAGRSYSVKLTKPSREKPFPIAAAQPSGCTLQIEDDFLSARADIHAKVRCTSDQGVLATAVLRERVVSRTAAEVKAGDAIDVSLPSEGAHGAVRVTLWTRDRKPLAERLVYRGLRQDLKVTVTADKASYVPRERVTLTLHATDPGGAPAKADLAVAVVDDTVLNLADDKTGNILAHLYVEGEMPGQRVFEPNYYFSADKKAPEAMDLVMGTQGWRRFAWKWAPPGATIAVSP